MLDIGTDKWPRELRHTRDFIDMTESLGEGVSIGGLSDGDIAIFQKIITVEGHKNLYPCHIAIVSNVHKGQVSLIHTSIRSGIVLEQEMSDWHRGRFVAGIDLDEERLINLAQIVSTLDDMKNL